MGQGANGLTLAGDVGGTNCRLALFAADGTMAAKGGCQTQDFPNPGDAIGAFLAEQHELIAAQGPVTAGAIAIAAPTGSARVTLTNSPWHFDRDALTARFGYQRLLLVNDLAAQAQAVLGLDAESFEQLGPVAWPGLAGTVTVVGPGTGLGVARIEAEWGRVFATEGGHVGFAPEDDEEAALLALWRAEVGRVTNEHVISGPGLVRVYRGVAALRGAQAEPLLGPQIAARALAGGDALCEAAAERFAAIYGAVCGDLVLAQGAGGVVLVGGISTGLAPILQRGGFRRRFEARGPGGAFLATTPSAIATQADLGLLGAFAVLVNL